MTMKPSQRTRRWIGEALEGLGVRIAQPPISRGRWLKWDCPPRNWYKINIDGSAINGDTSGGGIIRDNQGYMIASFSAYYGQGTNTSAEFMALRDGLRLCNTLRTYPVLIESDLMTVVSAIRTGKVEHGVFNPRFRS